MDNPNDTRKKSHVALLINSLTRDSKRTTLRVAIILGIPLLITLSGIQTSLSDDALLRFSAYLTGPFYILSIIFVYIPISAWGIETGTGTLGGTIMVITIFVMAVGMRGYVFVLVNRIFPGKSHFSAAVVTIITQSLITLVGMNFVFASAQ